MKGKSTHPQNGGRTAKDTLREIVWRRMEEAGVVAFPGAWGRIPNFVGAEETAKILGTLEEFQSAHIVSVSPDSPQRPIRELVLKTNKILLMGTPGLRQGFLLLQGLEGVEREASSLRGAFRYGIRIGWDVPHVDLKVVGSVAVNLKGARLGKGKGYFDLGYCILRHLKAIAGETPIVTNVHPLQLLDEDIPMDKGDVPVDYIVTLDEMVETKHSFAKPVGIPWESLSPETLEAHQILKELRNKAR